MHPSQWGGDIFSVFCTADKETSLYNLVAISKPLQLTRKGGNQCSVCTQQKGCTQVMLPYNLPIVMVVETVYLTVH
jgi:hypothetical protein